MCRISRAFSHIPADKWLGLGCCSSFGKGHVLRRAGGWRLSDTIGGVAMNFGSNFLLRSASYRVWVDPCKLCFLCQVLARFFSGFNKGIKNIFVIANTPFGSSFAADSMQVHGKFFVSSSLELPIRKPPFPRSLFLWLKTHLSRGLCCGGEIRDLNVAFREEFQLSNRYRTR